MGKEKLWRMCWGFFLFVLCAVDLEGCRDQVEQEAHTRILLDTVCSAVRVFQLQTKRVPASVDQMSPSGCRGRECVLEAVPLDLWGDRLSLLDKGRAIVIVSPGPNGRLGDVDDIVSEACIPVGP